MDDGSSGLGLLGAIFPCAVFLIAILKGWLGEDDTDVRICPLCKKVPKPSSFRIEGNLLIHECSNGKGVYVQMKFNMPNKLQNIRKRWNAWVGENYFLVGGI